MGSKSTNATTYNSILNGDFTGLVYVWDTKLGALKATITKGNTELFSASATFAGNGTADVGDIIIEAIGRAFTIDDIEVKKATQMNLKFDSIKGVIQLPELVYIDDELTLIAEANDGYRFRKWSKNGNLVSNNLEYTFVARNSLDLDCIFDISPLIYSENFNYMSQDDWTNSDDYNPWKHWGDDTKLSLNAIQVQQGKTVALDLSYFGLKTGKTYKISYDTYFNYNKYSGTDSIARKTLLGDVMLTYQDKDGYVYHGTKQTKQVAFDVHESIIWNTQTGAVTITTEDSLNRSQSPITSNITVNIGSMELRWTANAPCYIDNIEISEIDGPNNLTIGDLIIAEGKSFAELKSADKISVKVPYTNTYSDKQEILICMAFYNNGDLIDNQLKSYDTLVRTEKNITVKFNQIEDEYNSVKCIVFNEDKEPLTYLYEACE